MNIEEFLGINISLLKFTAISSKKRIIKLSLLNYQLGNVNL